MYGMKRILFDPLKQWGIWWICLFLFHLMRYLFLSIMRALQTVLGFLSFFKVEAAVSQRQIHMTAMRGNYESLKNWRKGKQMTLSCIETELIERCQLWEAPEIHAEAPVDGTNALVKISFLTGKLKQAPLSRLCIYIRIRDLEGCTASQKRLHLLSITDWLVGWSVIKDMEIDLKSLQML